MSSTNGPPTVKAPGGETIKNPYYREAFPAMENVSLGAQKSDPTPPSNDGAPLKPKKRGRGRPKKPVEEEQPPPPPPKNLFDKMMGAAKKQVKKKKRHVVASQDGNDGVNKKTTTAMTRESGKANDDELKALGGSRSKSSWNAQTLDYILEVRERMVDAVGFDERGSHEMYGEWPDFASGVVVTFPDPLVSAKTHTEKESINALCFSRPDILFWGPELRWPTLYPRGRPNCPFHQCSSCVRHDGWTFYPRRGTDMAGNTAIIARKYRCATQQKDGIKPYNFLGTASEVMSQAPHYVQAYWAEHGYILSHRGAVKRPIINNMRALLAHGAGASGFSKTLQESQRNTYFNKRRMWHAFVDVRYHDPGALSNRMPRTIFPEFDSPEYDVKVPSTTFMTSLCIQEIERRMPYYQRKLEMVSGRMLSGDHSHKIAKVILIEGKRGFQGLYTVMNEFGKVVGFWLVNSTNMREVEERLRDIERRYRLHGFQGPFQFTVDTCCMTRQFLAGTKNDKKKPVFPTLVRGSASASDSRQPEESSANVDDAGSISPTTEAPLGGDTAPMQMDMQRPPSVEIVQKHFAPPTPRVPQTMATAQTNAGIIAREVKEQGNVLFVDLEWTRNTCEGPGTIGIGLKDGSVHLFHVPTIGGIPAGIKTLMEEPTIQKVGNRFHCDIKKFKEVNIAVANTVELGKMAKVRGIFNQGNSSLGSQSLKLLDVTLPKEDNTRCSPWNSKKELTEEQIEYAIKDVYATRSVFLALNAMPWIDPFKTASPKREELRQGTEVLVYAKNCSQLVAHGTVSSETPNDAFDQLRERKMVLVRIKRDDVLVPITKTCIDSKKTLNDLFVGSDDSSVSDNSVEAPWKWESLRIMPDGAKQNGNESNIISRLVPRINNTSTLDIRTKFVTITAESGGAFEDGQAHMTDDDWLAEMERIKNDIVHIFLRFQKVVSIKHGCFSAFMARLSDAFFVPSHSDVDFIKTVLKESGCTEEEIKAKPWRFYKDGVRCTVPSPAILEANLQKVFDLFADEVDQKTKKKFFGEKGSKARKLVETTLQHVRTGCLSDVPGVSYYVQIGEDSMGIPKYKCFRGTNALEGFHQKIRLLIRAFNISPRYAIALLFEFIHRWNHDIDCKTLNLSGLYKHFYDGHAVEEEMEFTRSWGLDSRPHEDWISTSDFASTCETFGLVGHSHKKGDDEELDNEIQAMIEAMDSGLLEVTEEKEEVERTCAVSIPESSAWISRQLRTTRSMRPVLTETEKKFYQDNRLQFQSSGTLEEADNYSSLQLGAFTLMWNECIKEEEDGKRPRSDMTLKNAFHLQQYEKQLKQESNASLTMVPIADANKSLRRELRGREHASQFQFPEALPAQQAVDQGAVNVDNDPVPTTDNGNIDSSVSNVEETEVPPRQEDNRVFVPPFALGQDQLAAAQQYRATQPHLQRQEPKQRRAPTRCRECGHAVKDPKWEKHHREGPKFKVGSGDKRTRPCTVKESDRLPKFPLPKDVRMSTVPYKGTYWG